MGQALPAPSFSLSPHLPSVATLCDTEPQSRLQSSCCSSPGQRRPFSPGHSGLNATHEHPPLLPALQPREIKCKLSLFPSTDYHFFSPGSQTNILCTPHFSLHITCLSANTGFSLGHSLSTCSSIQIIFQGCSCTCI